MKLPRAGEAIACRGVASRAVFPQSMNAMRPASIATSPSALLGPSGRMFDGASGVHLARAVGWTASE